MTDEDRAKDLLIEIDGIARDTDEYEYGLPLFNEAAMAALTALVVAAIRTPNPSPVPDPPSPQ